MTAAALVASNQASCHGQHHHQANDARLEVLERRLTMLEADSARRYGVEKTSGQGDAVFSWDEALTAAMPAEARACESVRLRVKAKKGDTHSLSQTEPRRANLSSSTARRPWPLA